MTNEVDLCRLPSLSSHHPFSRIQHPSSFVSCPDIFLKEASLSKKIVPVQATERILLVDLAAIQRELLALQRYVSDSTALPETVSQVNWMTSMKQIIWSI